MYQRYRLRTSLFLLVLLAPVFISPGSQAIAQEVCARELADAQEHYTFGRFDQAIQVLNRCLGKQNVSAIEQRQAHRLISLSYIGQDDMEQARASVRDLLRVAPDYEPDRDQDPPPFVDLVKAVKQEMRQAPVRNDAPPRIEEEKGGGIGKWLLIGGGVVLAGAAAVLLTSGGDDGGDGDGPPQPTTLDEREPNDEPTQAQVVRGTAPITVRGNAESSDVSATGFNLDDGSFDDFEDWYQITTTSPGVRLTLTGLSSDCDLYLMEPGTLAFLGTSGNPDAQSESINLSSLAAGTYLIAVSIFDPIFNGVPVLSPSASSYTLTVDAAVTGNSLRVATADINRPGGAMQALDFRLVAQAGGNEVPLADAVPASAKAWTAYHEAGGALLENDGTDTFRFRPGRGFWMQSEEPFEASRSQEAPLVVAGDSYDLPLEAGWNIIANPVASEIDWAVVQAVNGITESLWQWDGHFAQTDAFVSAQDGEAFYFLNASGLKTLTIPALGIQHLPTPERRRPDLLKLAAYREGNIASAVEVGFAPDAAHGLDGYDQVAPPGYFEAARLRLARSGQGLELASELRPWQGEGQHFDLTLDAPLHQAITLQAEDLNAFAGYAVWLIDMEGTTVYDLHRQASVTVVPTTARHRLRLVIGTQAFAEDVRDAVVPQALSLGNYPNPFNPSTQISYTVPASASGESVRLEVFDVSGRLIHVLVDGVQVSGSHQVMWDGTNRAGRPVASGLYLSRLRVGKHTAVNRMLLMK